MRQINLNTLLVKYYNDYLDTPSCERVRGGATYLFQIGILSAKGITKNVANLEVCGSAPDPLTTRCMKVVIVVLYE